MLCPNSFNDEIPNFEIYSEFASEFSPETYHGYGAAIQMIYYYASGTTADFLGEEGAIAYTPEVGEWFWEPGEVICDRVQEMLFPMVYMSWVAGDYTCFNNASLGADFPLIKDEVSVLNIRLKNRGMSKLAENVNARLTSNHPSVSVPYNWRDFGDIPARSYQSTEFFIQPIDSIGPGEKIPFQIEIYHGTSLIQTATFDLYSGIKEIIFSENAENGTINWENWNNSLQDWDSTFVDAIDGFHCMADSRYGNVNAQEQGQFKTTEYIDIADYENPYLSFCAKWSLDYNEAYAKLFLEMEDGDFIYPNCENYEGGINAFTGTVHWVQEHIDLSDYQDQPFKIGFEINNEQGITSDGFFFDQLELANYSIPIDSMIVSVEEIFENTTVQVWPQPAKDILNIMQEGFTKMEIYNANGQLMMNESLNKQNKQINVASFAEGVYLLNLIDQNQNVRSMKILIQ